MGESGKSIFTENDELITYQDIFTINKPLLLHVAKDAIDNFKPHIDTYKELGLLEQDVFRFYGEENKTANPLLYNQLVFLATYFDNGKRSDHHYNRHVKGLIKKIEGRTLANYLQPQPRLFFSHIPINGHPHDLPFKEVNLINYLNNLDDHRLNLFLREVIIAARIENYDKYLARKKASTPSGRRQDSFKKMLDILVTTYESDPAKLFTGVSNHEGYQRLIALPGIDRNMAGLITLFFAEAGIIDTAPLDLDIPPKVDKHDITTARLTGVLSMHKDYRSHEKISHTLSDAMYWAAKTIGASPMHLDYAFWAASQICLHRPQLYHHLNPCKNFFTPQQYRSFNKDDYFSSSWIYADDHKQTPPAPRTTCLFPIANKK